MLLASKSEKTLPQLPGGVNILYDNELHQLYTNNYKTYTEMRSDATIAFARMLTVAPLVNTGWSYVSEHEEALKLVRETMELFRIQIMKQAVEGYVDYGWTNWEVVWGVNNTHQIIPVKFKALLQPYTTILINPDTGDYLGLRQDDIDLFEFNTLHIVIDSIGTDWYGRPLLENCRTAYLSSINVNAAADQYDKKVAGSHWVIHYPIGSSPYGTSKKETDNYEIASEMLKSLTYSGQFIVPRRIATFIDDMNRQFGEDQWKIELITDKGRSSSSFIERQKYLDTLKVRGLGFPERSILEGQFGTKAESETHANIAVVNFEMRQQIICQQLNNQIVNDITYFNFGQKNIVKIQPMPLANIKQIYWKEIYKQLLTQHSDTEYASLDMTTFRKNLDLPEQTNDPLTVDPEPQPTAT